MSTARAAAALHYRDAALGHRVAAATPHELVAMLYDGARTALLAAERAAAAGTGNAALRVKAVTRSLAILDALDAALDHVRGGGVARALALAYAQVRALVVAGNSEQRSDLFGVAALRLGDLGESWAAIAPGRQVARAV